MIGSASIVIVKYSMSSDEWRAKTEIALEYPLDLLNAMPAALSSDARLGCSVNEPRGSLFSGTRLNDLAYGYIMGESAMHVTIVEVRVRPEHIDEFVAATRQNHEASVLEPGNCRFDVLQSKAEPARFVLYEAYLNAEAAVAHKQTAHYLHWRDAVAGWMAEPRQGVAYTGLFPVMSAADRHG